MKIKLIATSIDHINMLVKSLDETATFYNELFGFEILKPQPEENSLIIGNESIKLCIYEDPDAAPDNGLQHFGFHISNYNEVMKKSLEMGLKLPYGEIVWENSRSIYLTDPNGYDIELSEVHGGGL
jgi:catechol-2,3-dioxygenase